MLLSEKEPAIRRIGDVAPEESFNRAVTVGVMQAGRLVILVGCNHVLTQGEKTCGSTGESHVVGPDRVELVELVVEGVASIFRSEQNRAPGESHVIEARVVSIPEDDDAKGA